MPTTYSYALTVFLFAYFNFPAFSEEANNCGNNKQAVKLSQLIMADEAQKRLTIRCNKLLTLAAEEKAKEMAEFGLVIHNLGGSPNSRLIKIGYKLPEHYGEEFNSNQVEAIAGGYSSAKEVWQAFKRSEGHRTHLLGEHEFYIEQDEIGIGFIQEWESPHVEYWVVYLTKGFEKNQSYQGDVGKIPNKSTFVLKASKTAK